MMPIKNVPDDNELKQRLPLADADAFTEVFNRYWDRMFIHALKMTGNEDKASDIVQETFTAIWTKACDGELHIQNSLSGYLYIATRNRVLNSIRQEATRTLFEEALAAYIDHQQHSVIEKINEKELAAALDSELINLPPKMRAVFELSRKNELSHKEIAKVLKISDQTVKKQVSNAIRILRVKLGGSIGILSGLFSWMFLK